MVDRCKNILKTIDNYLKPSEQIFIDCGDMSFCFRKKYITPYGKEMPHIYVKKKDGSVVDYNISMFCYLATTIREYQVVLEYLENAINTNINSLRKVSIYV